MTYLVLGAHGQVGRSLVEIGGEDIIGLTHSQLDITDENAVRRELIESEPQWVINAAAYTAVDKAEEEEASAYAVNTRGPGNLARICAELGIPFFHISTDYVFDGKKEGPYIEEDMTSPLGVYGQSKLAGEHTVAGSCEKFIILRTSWVYSPYGSNFVKTMLRVGAEREELKVVADQFGGPTSALDIAHAILKIVGSTNIGDGAWGIYHFCGQPKVSWYYFSKGIISMARENGWKGKVEQISPITSQEWPTIAQRPANSFFNCNKIQSVFNIEQPNWEQSLELTLKDIMIR